MIEGQKVKMTRGHYAGRPGIIVEVKGSKCTVTLTDTPNLYDVVIRNVKSGDYQNA